jgi:hypothetical protein
MKRQDYVFGSTTSNKTEQSVTELNNGWVELSILYSRVLNGALNALSSSTNDVSQEVSNAIVGMGVTLNPSNSSQLLAVLQKMALKASDFESPITASNKGATMKEIEEVVTSSLTFKGFVSKTQPTQVVTTGNIWINSETMPTTFPVAASSIKQWNGTAWVAYGSSFTPVDFDFFRNNNNNEGYYWFGGEWKIMSTDMSTTYFTLNQTSGKWEISSTYNNTLVHKTGNETIDGTKTFTNNIVYQRDIDQSVLPSSNQYIMWSSVKDKNYKVLSYIETTQFNTGDVAQAFGARREDSNGTQHTASLTIKINSDFTKSYKLSESPANTSNSTDIATTAWFNNKMKVVSALPSSPDANVFYFVTE